MKHKVLLIGVVALVLPLILAQDIQDDDIELADIEVIQNDYEFEKSCERGEEFSKCGDRCEATCFFNPLQDERPDSCGKKKCTRGCFCKEGWVRYGKKCIPLHTCPSHGGNYQH